MVPTAEAPTSRTQRERSALSDARMADAAVTLLCQRGAAATTLKDVGVLAGYSRGLAGYRFGSKAGLWSFLVRTIGDEWLVALRSAVAGTEGVDAITAAVDAHCHVLLGSSERIRAFYLLWFDSVGPDPEPTRVIANVNRRRRRDVERWIRGGVAAGNIRPDIDAAAVAEQFCAAIIGIVYQWLVSPEAHREVWGLHDGLKAQMRETLALRDGQAVAP